MILTNIRLIDFGLKESIKARLKISFAKASKAPITTLIVKDRHLGHNPAASLYQGYPPCNFYYGRLGKATAETGGR